MLIGIVIGTKFLTPRQLIRRTEFALIEYVTCRLTGDPLM